MRPALKLTVGRKKEKSAAHANSMRSFPQLRVRAPIASAVAGWFLALALSGVVIAHQFVMLLFQRVGERIGVKRRIIGKEDARALTFIITKAWKVLAIADERSKIC